MNAGDRKLETPGGSAKPRPSGFTCANLMPQACLIARQRTLRRNRWGGVVVACALALACGGFARFSTMHAVDLASDRLAHLQARQAELDRQLGILVRTRGALYEQARRLAALRQSQPLPEQLVALAAEAPGGILLTDLRAEAPAPPAPDAAHARPTPPAAAATAEASAAAQTVSSALRTIHLSGYALDHEHLTQLIESVRKIPNWQQVELVRASREPLGAGQAIAFRLECRERSPAP